MKDIKGVGFSIPANKDVDDFIDPNKLASLADVDIAIFNTERFWGLSGSLNNSRTKEISELVTHWQKEVASYLSLGKTLFVIMSKKESYEYAKGDWDLTSSTITNYEFLPEKLIVYNANGTTMIPCSNLAKDLYNNFGAAFRYESYVDKDSVDDLLFTPKSGDRVLGGIIKVKAGNIVLLPKIDFNDDEYLVCINDDGKVVPDEEYDEDAAYEWVWSPEAIQKGFSFKNCILAIDKVLRGEQDKSIKPNWIKHKKYELKESITTKKEIETLTKEAEKISSKIDGLNAKLEDDESLKDLLFETGKPLEMAVIKALSILGYTAENYDDGVLELDQIIISPEGDRLIGEYEGKDKKDIDITKCRQLQDHLNADFEREEVTEKAYGLLIGNPQRLIDPAKRTLDFTAKCKISASREKMGLILTTDLFNVCRTIIENEGTDEYAKSCRMAIKAQLGNVVKFPAFKQTK